MGFIHDIKRILPLLPKERQTLFFSATMPSDIVTLANSMLHDPVHGAVGAAHAGWRGAACGIAYKTVLRMQELFGTDPGNLRAAIGAAIGPCCFETDADVPQALEAALGAEAESYITRRGPKWHVDLKGVNARWLEKAGVRQIDVSPDCTACHPELYWSHRRMGQARGAQIAMICL